MHKQHHLTWTQVPHLFTVDPFDSLKLQIINDCCTNSQSEFLLKNQNPLRKNPNLFIHLPFKKNKDVNPTKANRRGMNPDHFTLAKQELSTLLSEGLIEPTSPWAYEAFYVNKHAEQVRGKLILVSNYQDLNHFLADDKFPLPNKTALFQHLSNAKVFSKFDLKVGF